MKTIHLLPLFLCGACASDAPELERRTVFDASAGAVTVTVLGDGFVRAGERRVPLEAFVLELRQQTRAMAAEELLRLVVHVLATPQVAGSPAAQAAQRDIARFMHELEIMGVKQVRLL